jgi:cobalt/nickel transport system permease protein
MHMADALLSPGVAGTMYVLSGAAAYYAARKLKSEKNTGIAPEMGVLGAFVFAAQMINFAIPGTGSSGHLCGGMLLSAVVGPYGGFLTMIGVMTLQCLLFGDGGLLALGANIWNMAFYGCFLGGGIIWPLLTKGGLSKRSIAAASILGSALTLQLGAFSVSLETFLSGITELPFTAFLLLMQPIHLVIGLVEGLLTSAVLIFVYENRPELLRRASEETARADSQWSRRKLLGTLMALALATGGILSLFASGDPDGLEWSIANLTGSTELEGTKQGIYGLLARFQQATALLSDYQVPGLNEKLGTAIAGIVGTLLVLGIVWLLGRKLWKAGHHETSGQCH